MIKKFTILMLTWLFCVKAFGAPVNDMKSDAIMLTDLEDWCSANRIYSLQDATLDEHNLTCGNANGGNVWFKFTAITNSLLSNVRYGNAALGTLQQPNFALYNEMGDIISCAQAGGGNEVNLSSSILQAGDIYYLEVSVDSIAHQGDFTLCLNNDIDYKEASQSGTWTNVSWYTGQGPFIGSPNADDIVKVKGHQITIDTTVVVKDLTIEVVGDETKLVIPDGEIVTVQNDFLFLNENENQIGLIELRGDAKLIIGGDFRFIRNGGEAEFTFAMYDESELMITGDFLMETNGGTVEDPHFEMYDDAQIVVSGDALLKHTDGELLKLVADDDAQITFENNVTLSATSRRSVEIELNNNAYMRTAGQFTRDENRYGIFDCNGNGTIEFYGEESQIFPTTYGRSGDRFFYQDVIVNNTTPEEPQLYLDGAVLINSTLTLIDGIVHSNYDSILIMNSNTTVSSQSDTSYVRGPIRKIGFDAFEFPVGDSGEYRPIFMSDPIDDFGFETPWFTAEYIQQDPDTYYPRSSKVSSIHHLNKCEYWILNRDRSEAFVEVSLSFKNYSCGIHTLEDLVVARFDDIEWQDHGNGGTEGDPLFGGTVISEDYIEEFSPFTVGTTDENNLLPVELIFFKGFAQPNKNWLNWATATESNAFYFEVLRAAEDLNFAPIGKVLANGNSDRRRNYELYDDAPLSSGAYYQLRTTDYDGTVTFSDIIFIGRNQMNEFDGEIAVMPNPLTRGNPLYVESFNLLHGMFYEWQLSNTEGQIIATGKNGYNSTLHENHQLEIHANVFEQLNKGNYIVTLKVGDDVHYTQLILR